MVSHKPLLYENLTARENLLFFCRLYDLDDHEGRIKRGLERVGLAKRGSDLVRTYSRGMLQRLSIARALLHDPHVLLMDEPYTGLDQDAAATLDGLMRDAHAEGHTIVMTTHELDRAANARRARHHPDTRRDRLRRADDGRHRRALLRDHRDGKRAMTKGTAQRMKTPFFARRHFDHPQGFSGGMRSRELVGSMGLFALLSVLVFSFALELDRVARTESISGVLWVTVVFASILGLNRSMAMERDQGNLDALLLAPIHRAAIFVGKLVGNFVFTLVIGLLLLPLMTILYNVSLISRWLIVVLVLGTLGFTTLGTLLAAMTVQTRSREALLPIVMMPVVLPLLLAAVRASTSYPQRHAAKRLDSVGADRRRARRDLRDDVLSAVRVRGRGMTISVNPLCIKPAELHRYLW